MITLGLTGSIGMGKSATAQMFQDLGIPVYDADAAVHRLYEKGGPAAAFIEQAFPGTTHDGAVDRAKLSQAVVGRPEALAKLEQIIHPLVAKDRERFTAKAKQNNAPLVVYDIPLLFEKGGDKTVDYILVVSVPVDVQRARVLNRKGMTEKKLNALLATQVPDAEKRARADFIIETHRGFDDARAQVQALVDRLLKQSSASS